MRGEHGIEWNDTTSGGDHPRMRGEHDCVPEDLPLDSGSSPHARGTLDADGAVVAGVGIIPACAGNT